MKGPEVGQRTMNEEVLKPGWLDKHFVKNVLKSVEGLDEEQQISISKWHCKPAVPPGTNYLSLLYRLFIQYRIGNDKRSISLIVKTPLESGRVKEFVEKIDGYGKELMMYNEVLPRMYELAQNSVSVTARSYVCPLHNSLVLEDLQDLGYKMSDRLKQLDADHCKQFLISLAKFHGLSVALKQKDPQLIERVGKSSYFQENIPEEDKKKQEEFAVFNLTAMLKTVESMGLVKYAELIQGKIESFYETMERLFKPAGELRVLNHGDCWTTNALFKYNDSNEVKDAKLVDFQTIRLGSYAQDVIFFWWTSARQDVRENMQEEVFEVYLKTLNQTLEDLQMKERVSKEEFEKEIKRFSPYALQVCSFLTVVMADPDDLEDFNDRTEDELKKPIAEDSNISKNFRSKYYKAMLPDLLRQMEDFGAFI